jgi:hypothetical protein
MFATNPSLMVVYCHVVILAEAMEHDRDLEQEEALEEIIRDGDDDITSQFLNDSDGEGREDDGSGDRMEEGEDDGSAGVGALTVAKSGEVYILIKPLLTRCINCFVCTYINASFFF